MTHSPQPWPDLVARRCPLPNPTDLERAQHMVQAIDRLQELATRFTESELWAQELQQREACRCLSVVGEAAAVLSPTFWHAHSAVAWQRGKNYRRQLVQAYYRVTYRVLWQRWHPASQPLRQQLTAILAQEGAATSV